MRRDDRSQYCKAAGAIAEAVIRSVESDDRLFCLGWWKQPCDCQQRNEDHNASPNVIDHDQTLFSGIDNQELVELICTGVFWRYFVISFLPLGSHPAMLFDPLISFSLRVEIAEVARRAMRPLHFDAPMVALPDGSYCNRARVPHRNRYLVSAQWIEKR